MGPQVSPRPYELRIKEYAGLGHFSVKHNMKDVFRYDISHVSLFCARICLLIVACRDLPMADCIGRFQSLLTYYFLNWLPNLEGKFNRQS